MGKQTLFGLVVALLGAGEPAVRAGDPPRTTRQEQFFLVCSAEAAFEGSGEVCQFSSK
jgi:hypothetical protein